MNEDYLNKIADREFLDEEDNIREKDLAYSTNFKKETENQFINGVRAVISEISDDKELIENTPKRLLKAFD